MTPEEIFDPESARPSYVSKDVWDAARAIAAHRPSTPRPTFTDMLGGMICLTYRWEESATEHSGLIVFVVLGGEKHEPLYRPVILQYGSVALEGRKIIDINELVAIMNLVSIRRKKA